MPAYQEGNMTILKGRTQVTVYHGLVQSKENFGDHGDPDTTS